MKEIILYGGSFDPVTKAHVEVAEKVQARLNIPVYLVPTKKGKIGKTIQYDFNSRQEMCNMVYDKVSCIEQYVNAFSTWTLLKMYENILPDYYFGVLIGMDCANEIHRWFNHEELLERYTFIVVNRKGYEAERDWFLDPRHIYLKDVEIPEMSSTNVRKMLKNKDDNVLEYINESTYDYIVGENDES